MYQIELGEDEGWFGKGAGWSWQSECGGKIAGREEENKSIFLNLSVKARFSTFLLSRFVPLILYSDGMIKL